MSGGKALDAHNASREAEQHMAHLGPLLDHRDQVAGGSAKPEAGTVAAKRAQHAARQITPQPSGDAAKHLAGRGSGARMTPGAAAS